MRFALLGCGFALLLALPGCLDESPDGDDEDLLPDGSSPAAVAPDPLHWEESVLVGADPFNVIPVVTPVGGGTPCSTSASTCYIYDFAVNTTVDLEATLVWGLPASDFDLYLYQDDTQLSSDGINQLGTVEVPPTSQVLSHGGLAPGAYQFWVVAWNAAGDDFTLDVAFQT